MIISQRFAFLKGSLEIILTVSLSPSIYETMGCFKNKPYGVKHANNLEGLAELAECN